MLELAGLSSRGIMAYLASDKALVKVDLTAGEAVLRVPLANPNTSSLILDDDRLFIVTGAYVDSQWVYRAFPDLVTAVRYLPTEHNLVHLRSIQRGCGESVGKGVGSRWDSPIGLGCTT